MRITVQQLYPMSACYSITLDISIRTSRRAAATALRRFIATCDDVDFALDDYARDGIHLRSFNDLIRIFLAGWSTSPLAITRYSRTRIRYDNAFNASYGWEIVLLNMFKALVPHLHPGSTLRLAGDGSTAEYRV